MPMLCLGYQAHQCVHSHIFGKKTGKAPALVAKSATKLAAEQNCFLVHTKHINLNAAHVRFSKKRGKWEKGLYLRNLETKGEVSPLRMKWPDGPSPRNSENQDSCSISSLRIA